MNCIDSSLMNDLAAEALESQRQRKHHNLHKSLDDPCQRLLVAITPASYIPPHRHFKTAKEELFVILRGAVAILLFTEKGEVEKVVEIKEGGDVFAVEIPGGAWHTVVAIEYAVCLEVKAGPYEPVHIEDRASWAPTEGDANAAGYLKHLRSFCSNPGSLSVYQG